MLLRGRNTVGYTPYPTGVTEAFVEEAAATGIDIFRIFDALNDVGQMRPAIDAVRATGTAVAEVAVCYTGALSDPSGPRHTPARSRTGRDCCDGRPPTRSSPRCARGSTCLCTCTRTTPPVGSSPR